jgi:ribosomal protein L7/L12
MRTLWIVLGLAAVALVILMAMGSSRSENLPPDGQATMADVERLIRGRQKIGAIKCYREIHRVGLAEAKKAVEDLEARMKSSGQR